MTEQPTGPECNTENCTTPATHTDWKDEPICSECVASAVEFGEKAGTFKLITEPGGEVEPDMTHEQIIENIRHEDFGEPQTPISDAAVEILNADPPAAAAADALTIFEESLTETGLTAIKDQAAVLPAIAKNQIDYDQVYEFSTRLKRASVTARKKSKVIVKDLKSQFNDARGKVEKDLGYVIGIIEPIITDTITSRDYMESWTEALKENKALKLAAEQEKERERVRLEKHRLINEENERQRVEAARIETDRLKLERDRYEFECEKSRLSEPDAWDDGALHFAEWISQEQLDEMLELGGELDEMLEEKATDEPGPTDSELNEAFEQSKDVADKCGLTEDEHISTLREFGKSEPAEPINKEIAEQVKSDLKKQYPDLTEEIEALPDPEPAPKPEVFIYSTDPTEKEFQLLELAHPVISEIKRSVKTVIDFIDAVSVQGFESQTATTATRALIADITAAAAKFSEAVEPPTVTESDVPF